MAVALAAAVLFILAGAALIRGLGISTALGTLVISGGVELALVATVWGFARRRGVPWASLGFTGAPGTGKLAFSVAGIVGSLAVVAGYAAILKALGFEDALPKTPLFEENAPAGIVVIGALLAIVLAPLAEEMFFRGLVFGGLRRTIGPWGAAAISAGLFMLAHISPVVFIPIFLIGLVLAWVYAKTASLWYAILTHMGYNALVVYVTLR